MTQSEAEALVKQAVTEIQRISGADEVVLNADTLLMEEVPEFDSLKCVELELFLGERVAEDLEGVVLPRTKGPPEPITLGDVAARMVAKVNGE